MRWQDCFNELPRAPYVLSARCRPRDVAPKSANPSDPAAPLHGRRAFASVNFPERS